MMFRTGNHEVLTWELTIHIHDETYVSAGSYIGLGQTVVSGILAQ